MKSLSEGNFVSPLSASCLATLVRHGGMNISGVCTPVIGQAVGCKRERERERERERVSLGVKFITQRPLSVLKYINLFLK